MKFKRVEPKPVFPELEAQILSSWKAKKTFERSVEQNKDLPEFIFYDGPPFPTGNPHHGTVFISVLKDVVCRYKTMRGYHVPRSWGWDCHGLPIETIAEKNLGIKEKSEIETKIGVAKFNAECRRIVMEFNDNWKTYIDACGRWVDMDKPFRTLDRTFMESVLWAFKESHNKGLIYSDFRVSPYCYRCETPLSFSEIRTDDATRPKQDRAITVSFELSDGSHILAWTTTPWTLPSNLALAVHPEITYAKIRHEGKDLILAKAALPRYSKELGAKPEILKEFTGAELLALGLTYTPLFPYFLDAKPQAFRIIAADFVSTDDGAGVVHMAPAFGEDDYWACKKEGISVRNPVDSKGCFTAEVTDFVGKNVHEANAEIVKFLKAKGVVLKDDTIEHNYPHCWRCRTPLIYRALDAWYYNIEKIKKDLLETNKAVSWYPDSVKEGRFATWLESARDWNISRNRFWSTPIPVWNCNACNKEEVLGSAKEMEEKAGKALPDLHKEFLDEVHYPCACGGTMKRVPEVLDCWFESGSMPYGQFHYPFENAEHFRSHFPADFIVEYAGQIRTWFYYLHVLSTALFGKPAFKNCMVHGTLLAENGKKMSKSLKNYTDPLDLIKKHGGDSLRAYLLSTQAVKLEDLSFRNSGLEDAVKGLMLPLWNALSFFTSYAEIDGVTGKDLEISIHEKSLEEVDRFILSELELLIQHVTQCTDNYALDDAMRALPGFLDTLTNWYIRRSRERVWATDPKAPEKLAFYATLYRVLSRFSQILAPYCPFLAEAVWERLSYSDSVHLSRWPEAELRYIDNTLSHETRLVREIISAGLAIRAKEKIRVRQPLSRADLAAKEKETVLKHEALIKSELNIKELRLLDNSEAVAIRSAKVNARTLGPRIGGRVQEVIKAVKDGNFTVEGDVVKVFDLELSNLECEVGFTGKEGLTVESGTGFVIALDTVITPELATEGLARDLVRQIQELRKEAELGMTDRIRLSVVGGDRVLKDYSDYICKETLALELLPNLSKPLASAQLELGSDHVTVTLEKAA